MPIPIPHEPGDVDIIARKLGESDPPLTAGVQGYQKRKNGGKLYLKQLPPKVRAAICGDLLAGRSFDQMQEEYGICKATYLRYRRILRDYSEDLLTAKTEMRRRRLEADIQWTLGVAKEGVEMAKHAQEPLRDAQGIPLRGPDGEIIYRETPDTKAMSMFLDNAHAAIDRWGELRELSGKGADRKNARRMQQEEIQARKELQEAQQKSGFNPNGPLQVFVIPKLPGVEQYHGTNGKLLPDSSSAPVVDVGFSRPETPDSD